MKTLLALALISGLLAAAKYRERRAWKPAPRPLDPLDEPLAWWSPEDPFTIRDLLRSLSIMGAAGSGKTSSIGFWLAKALASCPRVTLFIIASKPEDRAFWQRIAEAAGRTLYIIAPDQPHRFNVLNFEVGNGADAREITQFLMTLNELLARNQGGERDPFWESQNRRTIQNAVEPLLRAYGKADAWDIQRFISGAPLCIEEMAEKAWQEGFHSQTMEEADKKIKAAEDAAETDEAERAAAIQRHDYELVWQYWGSEWPTLNDRTRTSILAGVMGILHVLNTGVVRDLIGTDTTITPSIHDEGAWVLVDAPVAIHGVSGAVIAGAWKYSEQRHILRRKADENTPVTCIWIDEYQNHITSFDPKFLAECRSHLGCMTVLTQSLHSFFSAIGGKDAQSQTKALMTNFGHKTFMTLGDEESAKYASSLVGRDVMHFGGTSRKPMQIFDEFMGAGGGSSSLSERIEDLIQPRLFMNGLRTGGPENDYIAEGWVIRNGNSFACGRNAILIQFSQR